ncbi:MAG: nuclear transport factor 2 family protein [Candidatus Omnitrophota bacterium]|nr:nuclear transport factor 2 family protein [Candidatus Omnitrophota bacterium]
MAKEWIKNLFSKIDRMDSDGFSASLAQNASFRFANAPAVIGRENIRGAVSSFFTQIKGLRHRILETWECGNTVICEGEVTYTRHNGSALTLPFVDILRMEAELIADYRIYMDISALFA